MSNPNTKTEWYGSFYPIYDVDAYVNHYEKMALAGWRLVNDGDYNGGGYKAIESTAIHYSGYLTKSTLSMKDEELEHLEEFKELAAASGWNFVRTIQNQLHIFECLDENPVPLDTDDEAELSYINHVMKRDMLIYVILGFFVIALMVLGVILGIKQGNTTNAITMMGCSSCGLVYAIRASSYFSWFFKRKKEINLIGATSSGNINKSSLLPLHLFPFLGCTLMFGSNSSTTLIVLNCFALVLLFFTIWVSFRTLKVIRFDYGPDAVGKWKPVHYILFVLFLMLYVGINIFELTKFL